MGEKSTERILPLANQPQVLPLANQPQVLPLANQSQVLPLANQPQVLPLANQPQVLPLANQSQVLPLANQPQVLPLANQSQVAYLKKPTVKVLKPKKPFLAPKKKVAAYARVSQDSTQLMRSLEAQVSHYTNLITSSPDWEFAGVYVDAGLTGTSIKARPEFKRMLTDCDAGKIDVILTKSISRFARNTVDLLDTVRRLKKLGIEVRFERENIRSLSGDGELMLSILASFAQEESLSISKNIRWTIHKKYREGQTYSHRKMLGYRWEEGTRVIVPEEAETVRFIFESCIAGMSMAKIAKALQEKGVKGIQGKAFSPSTVSTVLNNEQYTGCLLLQRNYSLCPRKQKRNRGERDMYRVDNFQPAIVSEEEFREAELVRDKRAQKPLGLKWSPFQGLVFCGKCGSTTSWFRSPESRKRNDMTCVYWVCNKKCRKKLCDCRPARERDLHTAVEELGLNVEDVARVDLFDEEIQITTHKGRAKKWMKE